MRKTYQIPPTQNRLKQFVALCLLAIMLFLIGSCEKDVRIVQFELTTTINPAEGGSISITDGSFNPGKEVTLTATPSQGYVFKNWSGAVAGDENPIKVVFNADKNISANFEKMDADADGVPDNDDECPETAAGQTVDSQGCAENQRDSDGDGVTDDMDSCNATPTGATVGEDGCEEGENNDTDGDGVPNDLDICADTPSGETVDENGCSEIQNGGDSDSDGVTDNLDECPETPSGETVDESGCSTSQNEGDSDGDGITDNLDACAETPSGETVDENGCSDSQKDTDGDGVTDNLDECPDTEPAETVNEVGCTLAARTFIPDDSFEQQLIDLGYDDVLDDYVITENIISIETLALNGLNQDLTDLTGLEDFVSLTSLFISSMTTATIDLGNHPLLVTFSMGFSEVEQLLADSLENLEEIRNNGSRITNAIINDCASLTSMPSRDSYYDNLELSDNPLLVEIGGFDDTLWGDVRVEDCALFEGFIATAGVRSLEFINCDSVTSVRINYIPSLIGFPILDIVLTDNQNLTEIEVLNAGLTSLAINGANAITDINLEGNLLTALDVSTIANLENLSVLEENLDCIQVTQDQLDNIPATWAVGSSTYSLDCGL